MNNVHSERSERVFSSAGRYGLTSDNAKFFAYPVQAESASRPRLGCGPRPERVEDSAENFSGFAFKAPTVCGKDGLGFTPHLFKQDEVFEQAWGIYGAAFSAAERRTRHEQLLVMRNPRYRFSAVMHAGKVVGVLAWWKLQGFCFVEHFAIAEAHRSGGFGRRAMELLQAHVAGPIVVDVEPFGADYHAARRVAFYNRLGFLYCGRSITLPPYQGKAALPSNFMVCGGASERVACERVFETICSEIYNRRDAVSCPRAV